MAAWPMARRPQCRDYAQSRCCLLHEFSRRVVTLCNTIDIPLP
jgi:hypothetical protein